MIRWRGPLYMGKQGSICHFPRALPASIWGHPQTLQNKGNSKMTNRPCFTTPQGAPPKKGNGTTCNGGCTILKVWGGRNLLDFPGLGDLQPYETWKFRICSESVFWLFPDVFWVLLLKFLAVPGAPPIGVVFPPLPLVKHARFWLA